MELGVDVDNATLVSAKEFGSDDSNAVELSTDGLKVSKVGYIVGSSVGYSVRNTVGGAVFLIVGAVDGTFVGRNAVGPEVGLSVLL
jgi:uncharacterized protein YcfJ